MTAFQATMRRAERSDPPERNDRPSHAATVVDGGSPEARRCERRLLRRGRPLPLPHRSVWTRIHDMDDRWFVVVRDAEGEYAAGFGAELHRTRALPGHRVLRIRRLGGHGSEPVGLTTGIRALAREVRSHGRILRAHIEAHSPDTRVRGAIGEACVAAGFRPEEHPRGYAETIAIDLSPDLDEMFASLHATGRRHVRAVAKNPTEVREIDDPAWAARLDALLAETMRRTGGSHRSRDWTRLIEFCVEHPELARLVGTVRTDVAGPDALLAFALGYAHGDHVEYATAASTRRTELKMPLAYGLAWDLIRWGKEIGAEWFDFGGVTRGTHGDDDPRGGISDFKRYFSRNVVRVGEEWVLEPHPLRAAVGGMVSSAAAWMRSMRADRPG